nr:DUF58 domain-containing protein [Thiospirillum jenense]
MRRAPLTTHGSAQIAARHIYIMPTAVGFWYGVLLFVTLIGALNYQNNLGLLLTFLMISISLVSMHHTWYNLLGLRIQTQAGAPVFCGQMARFVVQLDTERGRTRYDLRIRGSSDVVDKIADSHAQVVMQMATQRRGPLPINEIEVSTRYPLGLFHAWSLVQADAVGLVYPSPAAHAKSPAQMFSIDHNAKGDHGVGADDFVGPRPYRAGDSPRHLDWKALARERGLITKQFGGDQAQRVWLDWAHLPAVDVETRLALLCRQVLDAADQQWVYGLRLPGVIIERNQGDAHRHRCLAALARFQISSESAVLEK